MGGYDLLLCEMSLPDTGLGPETIFCTRAFDGVFNDLYRITADGHLFGPVEQVLGVPNRPPKPADGAAATSDPATGPPLAWNGNIPLWNEKHPQLVFYACFVDGRCVRILRESDYRSLMEKGRRWALASLFST